MDSNALRSTVWTYILCRSSNQVNFEILALVIKALQTIKYSFLEITKCLVVTRVHSQDLRKIFGVFIALVGKHSSLLSVMFLILSLIVIRKLFSIPLNISTFEDSFFFYKNASFPLKNAVKTGSSSFKNC